MPRRRLLLSGLLLAFIYMAWAVPFMLESSVVAIDGQRYFGMFDDAMISMRYAWNFSHGEGLVWNPGERIEGYTNLLWTLVMSVFTGLLDKVSAVLAMQILGVLIVLACALMTWKLAVRAGVELPAGESMALGAAAVAITLTYYPLSHFTLTGMETGLLTLLVAAALYALEGYTRSRDDRSLLTMALLLGLAYLTREDSAIFSIPIFVYVLAQPDPKADLRARVRSILPAARAVPALSRRARGLPAAVLRRHPAEHVLPEDDRHAAGDPSAERARIHQPVSHHPHRAAGRVHRRLPSQAR